MRKGIIKRNQRGNKRRIVRGCVAAWMAAVLGAGAWSCPAEAAQSIKVDGNPSDWGQVTMQSSKDRRVEKWAIARDDRYVYFYVQQNGGNQYGLPITETHVEIDYDSGREDKSCQIRFAGMMEQLKDAWYGDIADVKTAYQPSSEAEKYEIEFAVPETFFVERDYTVTYCGTSVKSKDILDVSKLEETPQPTEAVYQGITVDGSFGDWDAVAKKAVGDGILIETAMVFDGDYLYLYMKETSDGVVTWSGEKSNGKFTIYTDTGRNTTFKLNKDSVEGIDGAKVKHSNCQYEISIPANAIKQYKETVSFGYYMNQEMLISDVANLHPSQEEKNFNGIVYDGSYRDWDYYPHDLIQYSTPGGVGGDAEAALYIDGTVLYGHVLSNLHRDEKEFLPFTIRVNENDKTAVSFRLVTADQDGNINMNPKHEGLDAGTYEYYLWDLASGSTAGNLEDADAPVFGSMYLTVRKTADGVPVSDEMEFRVDMKRLAAHFDMDVTDMKLIQAQYINIGTEWVSIAGASTGAVMGISLCGLSVLGVLWYRKRKCRVA